MSSNAYNVYNTSVSSQRTGAPVGDANLAYKAAAAVMELVVEAFSQLIPESKVELDVAIVPNPFHGVAPSTYIDSNETLLQLVDGGEDGETVPFMPLLVKARNVEVIFAIDVVSRPRPMPKPQMLSIDVRRRTPRTTGRQGCP